MGAWSLLQETLKKLDCDMGDLPEREQDLILECCCHRVPADVIVQMIMTLRRALVAVTSTAKTAPPDPAARAVGGSVPADTRDAQPLLPARGLDGLVSRLIARRERGRSK